MERITQAVILAAGEGQRLKPFTSLMPKVMLPIADKPILQYVIEALAENGIRRIIMIVGYKKEQVQDYFESGKNYGVEIEYVIQPQQLGVAHAIKQAAGLTDEKFMVIMGDNMIESGTIEPLLSGSPNMLLVKTHDDPGRYKIVEIQDDKVSSISTNLADKKGSSIDIGAYLFEKGIFEFIDTEFRLTPIMREMIAKGHEIAALRTKGFWQDAVYPWDLLKLNDTCLSKISPSLGGTIEEGVQIRGNVSIGDGTVIRSNCYIVGPVVIGENCEIGPYACIFPSTSIGNGVNISPFTVMKNSSIGNSVSVGPGSTIHNSIIAAGTSMGSHFTARSSQCTVEIETEHHEVEIGAIVGSYCEFGDNVIVEPGKIIGNNCRVKAMKLIGENIPDNGLVV